MHNTHINNANGEIKMSKLYVYEFTLHFSDDEYKDVEVVAYDEVEAWKIANYRHKERGVTICMTNYYDLD